MMIDEDEKTIRREEEQEAEQEAEQDEVAAAGLKPATKAFCGRGGLPQRPGKYFELQIPRPITFYFLCLTTSPHMRRLVPQ
jgi:hypothetical protein